MGPPDQLSDHLRRLRMQLRDLGRPVMHLLFEEHELQRGVEGKAKVQEQEALPLWSALSDTRSAVFRDAKLPQILRSEIADVSSYLGRQSSSSSEFFSAAIASFRTPSGS